MHSVIFDLKKYKIELIIPEIIIKFLENNHLKKDLLLNQSKWAMEVEDGIFCSHNKHPTEKGYVSDCEKPLSNSKFIKILIYGISISTKKLCIKEPEDFIKDKKPLLTSISHYVFQNIDEVDAAYYD